MKKASCGISIVLIGIAIVVLFGFIRIGIRPCSWLDTYLENSGCVHQLNSDGTVFTMAFTPDGTVLATEGLKVQLWRVDRGSLLHTLQYDASKYSVYGMALTSDGSVLAVSFREAVQLWQIREGVLLRTLKGKPAMSRIALSPDGSTLASGRPLRLWKIKEGMLDLIADVYYEEDMHSLAFSPDGIMLASGSQHNRIVWLWRASDGELLDRLVGHTDGVTSVAFSPDGKYLASGGWDDTVRVWRVSDHALLHILEGHTNNVNTIAFSPDSSILASGGDDDTVRLWRVSDGTLLGILKHKSLIHGAITSVAFSPDGTLLATAKWRGPVRLFDVEQILKQ